MVLQAARWCLRNGDLDEAMGLLKQAKEVRTKAEPQLPPLESTKNRRILFSLEGELLERAGELNAALSDLEHDDAVRSVIITGAGDKIFCAGADLGSAFQGADVGTFIRFGNSVVRRIERFPKPVVAAINGHALGGGCEIAMGCHIRILKETARMGQTESNLGITPGFGGTQRYPRLIGRGLALEHLILGTQIPAAECYRLGLANRLSKEGQTLDDARALARELAKRPPVATRLIIEAVDDGLPAPIDTAIEIEVRAFLQSLRTDDASEGIQAFFQKRPADFKGR